MTGKLPRTKEILQRLLAEEFELIGAPVIPATESQFPPLDSPAQLPPSPSSPAPPSPSPPPPTDQRYEPVQESDAAGVGGVTGMSILREYGLIGQESYSGGLWTTESPRSGANEAKYGVVRFRLMKDSEDDSAVFPLSAYTGESSETDASATHPSSSSTGGSRSSKKYWMQKQLQRRKASEKRGMEGAEGRWVVRLASQAEAGRLVRAWHMREFWTGVGGSTAEKVVMRAEIL